MTFQKVEPGIWAPQNSGDMIEGVFLGKDENVGKNNSKLYHLECAGNKPMNVWGSATLDPLMAVIVPGDKIQIVFKGLGEAKPGRSAPKLFDVLKDIPDQTQTQAPAQAQAAQQAPAQAPASAPAQTSGPTIAGTYQG